MKKMSVLIVLLIVLFFTIPVHGQETESVFPNKTWKVTFNTEMDYSNVYEAVFVRDENGDEVPLYIQPAKDKRSMEVTEEYIDSFQKGKRYTLHITTDLTSQKGVPLEETVTKEFRIHDQMDADIDLSGLAVNQTTKEEVMDIFGEAENKMVLNDQYDWEVYHNDYRNFLMVLYNQEGIVHGYYTNQDIFTIKDNHKLLASYADLYEEYDRSAYIGENLNGEPELISLDRDGVNIRLFLDIYNESQLTGVFVISSEANQSYSGRNERVSQQQIYEIINARRAREGLKTLKLSDPLSEVAQAHSEDMAENQYFDHTNPDGEGPFDRINNAGIDYRSAGENIAAGQRTGIRLFTHG